MKNNLKQVRTKIGMTQEQLAKSVGTSKSYISQLENGARNINSIRQSTMSRLCAVLDCTPDDLIIHAKFEIDEYGRLIVDSAYTDDHISSGVVILIDDDAFLLPYGRRCENGEQVVKNLRPIRNYIKAKDAEAFRDYEYFMYHCTPRTGFKVEVKRPITLEEFTSIQEEYNLTEKDISGKFETSKGVAYGEKYQKTYTCIQIRVDEMQAILLEQELNDKGIEATNGSPCRVNIRVDEDFDMSKVNR